MNVWNRSTNPAAFAQYAQILLGHRCIADSGSWTKMTEEKHREILATVDAYRKEGRAAFVKDAAAFRKLHPSSVHRIMAKHRNVSQ